jgi:NAD-dependent dihydropyrimidine dehydrogenase PreA subunit
MAYVISDSCIACGTCESVCPTAAISAGDIYKIDPDTCIDCGTCAESCPNEAIAPGE